MRYRSFAIGHVSGLSWRPKSHREYLMVSCPDYSEKVQPTLKVGLMVHPVTKKCSSVSGELPEVTSTLKSVEKSSALSVSSISFWEEVLIPPISTRKSIGVAYSLSMVGGEYPGDSLTSGREPLSEENLISTYYGAAQFCLSLGGCD